MKYIARKKSVMTGQENLEPLYTFKNFPVFFGCVEEPATADLRADMSWAIDPETGVIQLDKLIPLDILYQAQHVDGTGPTWQQYYHDLADYITKQSPQHILEIGGGAGDLAKIFLSQTQKTDWTIIEPNPWVKETDRLKVIAAFFDERFKYQGEVDAIVFSQLMEHVYDPQGFVDALSKYLQAGQKLIFAYPNLKLWLERKYTNALNFEHTMFLTDYFVDHLLIKYGFSIKEKIAYKDHSYFYTAEKVEKPLPLPPLENKHDEYKKIFLDFVDYHQELVKSLNKRINTFDGPIYLFGAHIFSQYLLEFGLEPKWIVSLLDNSKPKQGRRLYGSTLKVENPHVLAGQGKVGVILKVGIYKDEIVKQLKTINPNIVYFE